MAKTQVELNAAHRKKTVLKSVQVQIKTLEDLELLEELALIYPSQSAVLLAGLQLLKEKHKM